ncbi:unnamed protein product [Plutella xylostella]|uniref:(diamondback moth) hypothetical protein n=1 Tax=Plutella xylostella TaxID=51655 RepID=A0A8S4G0J2_PLUXY|nr:unnamed protein product [Plutella xylostella]
MVLTEDQFTQLLAAVGPKKGSIASCQATYNGEKSSEAVESFLTAINIFKQLENISEKDAITGLPLLLHGNAGKWWQGVKDEITTWTEFEKSLRNSFAPKEPAHIIYQKILQGKQEVGTTTEDFITDKRMLFATLPKPQHPETQQIDMIYGLLNIKIRDKIPRTSFTTYDQLVELSRGIELLQLEKDDVHKPGTSKINITKHQGKGKGRCSFCKNPGHSVEVCRKRQRMENSREDPQDTASRPNLLALPITQPKVSCYGCGAPGVVRTKCPNCSQKTQIAPIKPEDISFCSLNATDARARPVVFITINGFNGVAYIDTGAKMSVASYELYRHLCNQGCGFKQKVLNVTLADGITKRQTVLLAKVRVTLSDKEITTEFMVMPESRDNRTLLGIGFLTDAAMVLNLGQASWHFAENPNEEFELYNEDFATFKEPTDNPVVAAVSNTGNDPSLRAEKSRRGPIYGATASTNLDSTVPWNYNLIRIADLPPTPKRSKIFDGYSPQMDYMMEDARVNVEQTEIQLSPHSQQLFPVNRSIDDVSICSINVELTTCEQEQLSSLLNKYEDVFKDKRSPANYVEHRIDTMDRGPISVPPYRLSPLKKEILRNEIEKMLEQGVIEPCTTPWAAPVVLIPKPDNGIRVCVDYRRLNAITIPDSYPIPRLDDLLHEAKPALYMSALDLKAGYWQVEVRKEDREKTGFITPFGIYIFKRMPFGLRNAPATFQRLIDRLSVSLEEIKLLAYLDDLILFSPSFQAHLQDLESLFIKMREFNLTVNAKKCRFCCSSIKYLGHYITPKGLKVDPEKTAAIANLPTPTNVKHLLTFYKPVHGTVDSLRISPQLQSH